MEKTGERSGFGISEALARRDYNQVAGPTVSVPVPSESISNLRRKALRALDDDPDSMPLEEEATAIPEEVQLAQPIIRVDRFRKDWANANILGDPEDDDTLVSHDEEVMDRSLCRRFTVQVGKTQTDTHLKSYYSSAQC